MAAKVPKMAMTINSSTIVKPLSMGSILFCEIRVTALEFVPEFCTSRRISAARHLKAKP